MNFKDNYNIAIVGLGNIGSEVYRHLVKNKKIIEKNTNSTYQIKYLSANKISKKRGFSIPKKMWIKNPADFFYSKIFQAHGHQRNIGKSIPCIDPHALG